MSNKFRWTVRKVQYIEENGEMVPLGPIWFNDLKCWIGAHGIAEKQMHHQYTLERLEQSKSFQQALSMGWIETIDKYVPENKAAPSPDLSEIKEQMNELFGLVKKMSSQAPQVIEAPVGNDLLQKILDKVSSVNEPKSITTSITAQEAALKIREKMEVKKESNFDTLGNRTTVDIDINKLADTLIDLPLDDDD